MYRLELNKRQKLIDFFICMNELLKPQTKISKANIDVGT